MKRSVVLFVIVASALSVNGMPQENTQSKLEPSRKSRMMEVVREFVGRNVHTWEALITKVGNRLARNLQARLDQQIEQNEAKQFAVRPSDPEYEVEEEQTSFLSRMLRALNVDAENIAQYIQAAMKRIARSIDNYLAKPQSRQADNEGMVKKILRYEVEMMKYLYRSIQDKELPERVIQQLGDNTGNKSTCIQLLVCKASPVVWGMQKTISEMPKILTEIVKGLLKDGTSFVYTIPTHFPTLDEYQEREITCIQRFPTCSEESNDSDYAHETNQL